jgi:hypothetical protein
MKITMKQKIAATAAAVTIAGGAGIAFAAWTSSGSGTGSAQAGTSADSAIAGVTPVAANDLYPGAVKDTFVTVSNPNAYPVEVTSIGAGSSLVVGDCAADTVRTDAAAPSEPATALSRSDESSTVIAAGGSGTYQLVVRMSNDAADACKGKAFTVDGLSAAIRSAATTAGNGF